ncbi:MAG: hypothetical protein JST22_18935 [Bacteroidetes bacterium]|nr:hypothetical protein [Bacteroidota bacterium]
MQSDMTPSSRVNGTAVENTESGTPVLPLSIDVPSGHHAIVTAAFYGGNAKSVTIDATVSHQTWTIPHGLDKPGCNVLPFSLTTPDSDTLQIDVTCMTRPSSGTPEPMTPIDITWAGGGIPDSPSAQTFLVIYTASPLEAVGITIVVQVGSGPATGPGE